MGVLLERPLLLPTRGLGGLLGVPLPLLLERQPNRVLKGLLGVLVELPPLLPNRVLKGLLGVLVELPLQLPKRVPRRLLGTPSER